MFFNQLLDLIILMPQFRSIRITMKLNSDKMALTCFPTIRLLIENLEYLKKICRKFWDKLVNILQNYYEKFYEIFEKSAENAV